MKRASTLMVTMVLVATLAFASGCQKMVDVQTGTRTVDSQGRVISEDIRTVRVPQETAGAYRINTITQEDTASAQLAALYGAAQTAIAAGDLKTAATKLAEVIAISPTYRNAQKQSDAIAKGEKVTPDTTPSEPATSTTKPTPAPGTKPPAEISSALLRWMPDSLDGFTAETAAVDPLSVSRQYVPGSGNPAKTFVIVAEQFRTSAEAKRALEVNVKARYSKNTDSLKVGGRTVYFGTDGSQFAVIGFTSGPVMVALEASPDSGAPSTMKSVLVDALKQLP